MPNFQPYVYVYYVFVFIEFVDTIFTILYVTTL